MSKDLNIRVGDIVRIREAAVEKVGDDGTLTLKINMGLGFAYTTTVLHRAAIEEILYHSETPEEELERLRVELDKAPRWIAWDGAERPVDAETLVLVRLSDLTTMADVSGKFSWKHLDGSGRNIIAYMVLPE